MKFSCEIDNVKTLKTGMKITLSISEENVRAVMKDIYNFLDKPITVDLGVHVDEQLQRLSQISGDQRKKIYALLKDIADYTGMDREEAKTRIKQKFIQITEGEDFSFSDCSREIAKNFIDFLIQLAFEMGVPLKENPKEGLEDIEVYLKMCLKHKVCAICGKPGEIHHMDAIGMGRDRRKADDSNNSKICLCREHHTEAHKIGITSFENKYQVYGVV